MRCRGIVDRRYRTNGTVGAQKVIRSVHDMNVDGGSDHQSDQAVNDISELLYRLCSRPRGEDI